MSVENGPSMEEMGLNPDGSIKNSEATQTPPRPQATGEQPIPSFISGQQVDVSFSNGKTESGWTVNYIDQQKGVAVVNSEKNGQDLGAEVPISALSIPEGQNVVPTQENQNSMVDPKAAEEQKKQEYYDQAQTKAQELTKELYRLIGNTCLLQPNQYEQMAKYNGRMKKLSELTGVPLPKDQNEARQISDNYKQQQDRLPKDAVDRLTGKLYLINQIMGRHGFTTGGTVNVAQLEGRMPFGDIQPDWQIDHVDSESGVIGVFKYSGERRLEGDVKVNDLGRWNPVPKEISEPASEVVTQENAEIEDINSNNERTFGPMHEFGAYGEKVKVVTWDGKNEDNWIVQGVNPVTHQVNLAINDNGRFNSMSASQDQLRRWNRTG